VVLRDTKGGERTARLSDGSSKTVRLPRLPDPLTVIGPWSLSVDTVGPDGDGKVDLRLERLADWRDIPQLSSASGTGTYAAKLTVPEAWLAGGRGALLDLGAIGGMLELQVNGRRVPFASLIDGPRDVTELLKPGENELRASLATTVTNVIVARAQSGDGRYAHFAKNAKQPYGIIGPVRLIPFAEATLASLPRSCASRRRFAIRVRVPRGFRARSATLRIGGGTRRIRLRRQGRRLRATVDLRGRRAGTTRVRLAVRGTGRRTITTTRTYRLCVPRRR
jgi:hypothetical protein